MTSLNENHRTVALFAGLAAFVAVIGLASNGVVANNTQHTQVVEIVQPGASIATLDPHCITTDVATMKMIVVTPGDRAVIGDSVRQCQTDGTWEIVGASN